MSAPRVTVVDHGSPADVAGIQIGDEFLLLNGRAPRDVIEYQQLVDDADLEVVVRRGSFEFEVAVNKMPGARLGVEVHSALFDQVRTCDNHCEFCFIHQLPPGLRDSLYIKDDDYRLSFLYGNFTTLTRFTEADLERVIDERLSPINVSIHAINPDVRNELLRNRRGGPSLRWLRALLDEGVEVHGQIVVCPELNDGSVLEDTMAGLLDEYREIHSMCVVPLGVSRFNREVRMRPHTISEAGAVIDTVEYWQDAFHALTGRRVVQAADEYYLLAGRGFPDATRYDDYSMHEDGIGMARTFEQEFRGEASEPAGVRSGFFAWVDGAPADGYRAHKGHQPVTIRRPGDGTRPVAILSGTYGASVVSPLVDEREWPMPVRVVPIENKFFGGNTAVTGLLTGVDISAVLADEPPDHRYLLPDVCLSKGQFLDGSVLGDLPRPVEVVSTDGVALRRILEGASA